MPLQLVSLFRSLLRFVAAVRQEYRSRSELRGELGQIASFEHDNQMLDALIFIEFTLLGGSQFAAVAAGKQGF